MEINMFKTYTELEKIIHTIIKDRTGTFPNIYYHNKTNLTYWINKMLRILRYRNAFDL